MAKPTVSLVHYFTENVFFLGKGGNEKFTISPNQETYEILKELADSNGFSKAEFIEKIMNVFLIELVLAGKLDWPKNSDPAVLAEATSRLKKNKILRRQKSPR